MMGLVRQWLLGVTCTAMVLALTQALAPEGGVKKVCRLAGGLALLLAAVSPLLTLEEGAASRALEEYRAAVQDCGDDLAEKADLFYETIIAEETAAYIVDKAGEIGVSCQAEVTFAYDEDGVPYPWEVTARGVWTEEERGRLSQLIEADLGVPGQRQYYEERQP